MMTIWEPYSSKPLDMGPINSLGLWPSVFVKISTRNYLTAKNEARPRPHQRALYTSHRARLCPAVMPPTFDGRLIDQTVVVGLGIAAGTAEVLPLYQL